MKKISYMIVLISEARIRDTIRYGYNTAPIRKNFKKSRYDTAEIR